MNRKIEYEIKERREWWEIKGRMLGFDLSPLGPTAFWALFLAPWSETPNPIWLVGPRHTALYIEVGGSAGSDYEVDLSRHSHRHSPSRSERGVASDGKPPPSSLHRLPSPPTVVELMAPPANETPASASTAATTASMDGLRLLLFPSLSL
jgi:hypothetical protein